MRNAKAHRIHGRTSFQILIHISFINALISFRGLCSERYSWKIVRSHLFTSPRSKDDFSSWAACSTIASRQSLHSHSLSFVCKGWDENSNLILDSVKLVLYTVSPALDTVADIRPIAAAQVLTDGATSAWNVQLIEREAPLNSTKFSLLGYCSCVFTALSCLYHAKKTLIFCEKSVGSKLVSSH